MSRFFNTQCYRFLRTSFIPLILLSSFVVLARNHGSTIQGGNQLTLTGNENHAISQPDAIRLTRNYRNSAISGSLLADAFGKNAIQELLNQPDCVGLRVYFGKTDNGVTSLVLVGVTTTGTDLVNGKLLDSGFPCPPFCDSASPLAQ